MVERKVCTFCGGDIEPGTGRMYIKKDGTSFNFCSNKCRKNMVKLGRTPRWVKWTKNFVRAKGAEGAAPAEGAGEPEEPSEPKAKKVPAKKEAPAKAEKKE